MSLKRKFDAEDLAYFPNNAKQLKLVPFPSFDTEQDSLMCEAEPLTHQNYHTRISSSSSYGSSNADSPTVVYPTFDLYPEPTMSGIEYSGSTSSATPSPVIPVGLLQPSSSFAHHGSHCTTIPKLRIACNPGINGTRTMWSFCESCGAISMVDSD